MSNNRLPARWISQAPSSETTSHRNSASPEQRSALRTVLQTLALLRRHWFLVGVITACCIGALIYQMRSEVRMYRAVAVIRLEDKGRQLSEGISRQPMAQYRPFNDPV